MIREQINSLSPISQHCIFICSPMQSDKGLDELVRLISHKKSGVVIRDGPMVTKLPSTISNDGIDCGCVLQCIWTMV